MILDKSLTHQQKIYIAMVVAAVWIYFRTTNCYVALPRKNIISIVLVVFWIYLYNKDPLFLPIGLLGMYLFSLLVKS